MKSAPYDTIVIGSGFGGAAAAHTLAAAGRKTLVVERGGWARRDDLDWNQREILLKQRYRSESPILVRQFEDRDYKRIYPNSIVGGLSVFYGGASLRLRPVDFARWPITYDDLESYYSKSEQLLGVHGEAGQDPFDPPRSQDYAFAPIDFSAPARRIWVGAQKIGYRPFKIPLAINFSDAGHPLCIRCITCDGFPCKIEAKNDLTATLLGQGQKSGLDIMPGIVVKKLVQQSGRIIAAECVDKDSGRSFSLESDLFIVAAGALHSPALLLRSGLDGRCVGRYLMRHCNSVASMVFPRRTNPEQVFHKQLCFSDFYEDMRGELGTSVGVIQDIFSPPSEIVRHYAPQGFKRFAGLFATRVQNLLCIAEDDAQYDNRVELASEVDTFGMPLTRVTHAYTADDYRRLGHLTDKARRVLRAAGGLIPYSYRVDSFSHAVGSVRCGTDPQESALDPDCKFRGMDNLYVLDGSFMPTSGGVNPSLTIAANAFRVADRIIERGE